MRWSRDAAGGHVLGAATARVTRYVPRGWQAVTLGGKTRRFPTLAEAKRWCVRQVEEEASGVPVVAGTGDGPTASSLESSDGHGTPVPMRVLELAAALHGLVEAVEAESVERTGDGVGTAFAPELAAAMDKAKLVLTTAPNR